MLPARARIELSARSLWRGFMFIIMVGRLEKGLKDSDMGAVVFVSGG